MTLKEIEQTYNAILSLLKEKRLKEAFGKIASLISLSPNEWQAMDKLTEIESSYRYMIQYMLEGMADPNRRDFYYNLLLSTYNLTDKVVESLLEKESPTLYYQKRRYYRL